jgi:hypothetical protein
MGRYPSLIPLQGVWDQFKVPRNGSATLSRMLRVLGSIWFSTANDINLQNSISMKRLPRFAQECSVQLRFDTGSGSQ